MLAGLLLRLWFIHHLARVAGDSLLYGDIAKNLLLHRVYGFTEPGLTPGSIMIRSTLIRLPGYPLFLAVCFRVFGMENYRAALYVQVAADLLTCWLCAALAGRLFGRRAFLPVLWLAALCSFTASYVATPLTETLVLTSIALAFYGFARWQQAGAGYNRWLCPIAAALAWSILLRPEQGLLAAAVVPAMAWASLATSERRVEPLRYAAPVLVAALCIVLPLVPWAVRNWHTFQVFEPLAPRSATDPGEQQPSGFNRWYRTWGIEFVSTANAYWNYQSDRIEVEDLPERAYALSCMGHPGSGQVDASGLHGRTVALLNDYNQNTAPSPVIDARFAELAQERIQASPICYYVVLPVARLLDMTLRPRTEMADIPLDWWKLSEHPAGTVWAAAYVGVNFVYVVIGLAGLMVWRRRGWLGAREIAWAMAGSVFLRCALLLTLDNSEPRYTLEFFPVLFVWAGGLFARSEHRRTDVIKGAS
jgi:hypothetical protein